MIRRLASAVLISVFAFTAAPVFAGKFNKVINIGDAAPTYTKLPGTDGKEHSLADIKSDVVIIAITCNKCPMAIKYEDRMIELAKKYADKSVTMVAINVNDNEADGLEKMKERAKEKGFNFAYLFDASQQIATKLGARVTPEFFVLDKNRKIVYTGALDDNPDPSKVTKKYLELAVEAALAGKLPEVTETRAVGCGVQYKK